MRNRVTSDLHKAKQSFFNSLNPSDKVFWKVLKNLGNSTSSIPTLSDGQESVADDLGKAKGISSPQGREGMQLVIIKNYMNIFIFHK